jgi:hypothetical protein
VSKCGFDYPDYAPAGTSDHKVAVDVGDTADYLGVKISAGANIVLTTPGAPTSKTVQITATTTDTYLVKVDTATTPGTLAATTESSDGSLGIAIDGNRLDFTVVPRPSPSLTKRYYLTGVTSDRSVGGYNGFLLSTTNPSDEAHAIDLAPPASGYYNWFDSPVSEPGLATWPSGIVLAHIRARVLNAHGGLVYKLFTGERPVAYESVLGREGNIYNVAPLPASPVITASYLTAEFPLYVQELTGPSADRLRVDLFLQVTGGSITDEVLELRCGGDNASYFDTLFTPSSGGPTVHNDLTGRGYSPDNQTDCHPQSAITPGRVHSPTGTTIATVDGLFAMPESNSAAISGSEPLLGIAKAGWVKGDRIYVYNNDVTRTVQGSATVPDTHGAIYLGTQFQDPTNPGAGFQLTFTASGILPLIYTGLVWLLAAQPSFV